MTAEVTESAKTVKYLGLLGAIGAVAAASVADSYKDKRVKIIVGGPTGGGVERYGRAPGRHIFRHGRFRVPLRRSGA